MAIDEHFCVLKIEKRILGHQCQYHQSIVAAIVHYREVYFVTADHSIERVTGQCMTRPVDSYHDGHEGEHSSSITTGI
eukprot:scaffold23524_cov221-Amphora_coffeaeformis.AAC.1